VPPDTDDNPDSGGPPGPAFAAPMPPPDPATPDPGTPDRPDDVPQASPLPAPSSAPTISTDRVLGDPAPTEIDELLDADGSIVVVLDRGGSVRTINPAGLRVLGAKTVREVIPGSAPHALLGSLIDHVPQHLLAETRHGTWHGDFDHTDDDGRPQVFRATVIARPDERGGFVAVTAHDVTAARQENAVLRHRASHDPLTGLANRRQMLTMLRDAIARQRRAPGHVATLFVDLDRLKYVNDAFGHEVGDRLLIAAAARLSDVIRPDDEVARIGGDEFLVVCHAMPDAATALEQGERIRRALTGRLRVQQLDLQFSVSVGVALSGADLLDEDDETAAAALVSNADTAMYDAKRTGRGRSVLFTADMRSVARERTELAAALSHALAAEHLFLAYQPVFSATGGRATGAEALVRWTHPTRGAIDPETFVSVAEEAGSIGQLGAFVLRRAVADLRAWTEAGLVDHTFTVHANVSQAQLASPSFVNEVTSMIREQQIEPARVVLEARESTLMARNVAVQRTVRALRRLGIQIAIDDFGTGANALSVLTDIGADLLKLDGSLALPTGSSESDTRLVRALVLLAHALDMRVVAERVSGSEQLRRLRAAGCDFVQGNRLGPPVPADHIETVLSDRFDA
jgi:diguanylate cyclase (GGDEF)-like protein